MTWDVFFNVVMPIYMGLVILVLVLYVSLIIYLFIRDREDKP